MPEPDYTAIVNANNAAAETEARGYLQVTQAEYDALTPNPSLIYVVIG